LLVLPKNSKTNRPLHPKFENRKASNSASDGFRKPKLNSTYSLLLSRKRSQRGQKIFPPVIPDQQYISDGPYPLKMPPSVICGNREPLSLPVLECPTLLFFHQIVPHHAEVLMLQIVAMIEKQAGIVLETQQYFHAHAGH